MGEQTGIDWTDHTFNPWWGCVEVSPGCAHCYARTLATRLGLDVWGKGKPRKIASEKVWNDPIRWANAARKAGVRRRVFCASMADWCDPEAPAGAVARLWDLIDATRAHLDWQLLTKRPERIKELLPATWGRNGWSGVWLGTTVEDQQRANERIPHLLNINAEVKFLSCEPLLGPVDLGPIFCDNCNGTECVLGTDGATPFCVDCEDHEMCPRPWLDPGNIDWVICGGESGQQARPMHPKWAADIRRQCEYNGTPFFFKQWGEWLPFSHFASCSAPHVNRRAMITPDDDPRFPVHHWTNQPGPDSMYRVGKESAGHILDGETIQQFPEVP